MVSAGATTAGDVYAIGLMAYRMFTGHTAGHHTQTADIRDPAISYDATRVAFSMRQSETDCLNIYVMNINGSNLKQVTYDMGSLPKSLLGVRLLPLSRGSSTSKGRYALFASRLEAISKGSADSPSRWIIPKTLIADLEPVWE